MSRHADVQLTELRGAATSFEDHRAIRRLYGAMLYEQGVSAPTIADWFGVRPATVYAWLNRFETATDLAAAARDATRPGRPAKLSNEDRQAFFALLDGPPTDVGIETDEWTSEIARDLLSSRFGVEYSRRHVRRLVDQANAGGR